MKKPKSLSQARPFLETLPLGWVTSHCHPGALPSCSSRHLIQGSKKQGSAAPQRRTTAAFQHETLLEPYSCTGRKEQDASRLVPEGSLHPSKGGQLNWPLAERDLTSSQQKIQTNVLL